MNTGKRKPRVVLDTNVLISGIFWDGSPAKIIRRAERDEIEVVLSWNILEEIEEVLKRPYFEERFGDMDAKIIEISIKFLEIFREPIRTDDTIDVITDDPSDNRILECAVKGKVDYLISGDSHLLQLGEFQGIKILDPSEFLKKIKHDNLSG